MLSKILDIELEKTENTKRIKHWEALVLHLYRVYEDKNGFDDKTREKALSIHEFMTQKSYLSTGMYIS